MGCGQSKQDDQIAADFFQGAKESQTAQMQKDSVRSGELKATPQTPQNSARSQQDSSRSQPQVPQSPRQHSQSHIEQALSPRSSKISSRETSTSQMGSSQGSIKTMKSPGGGTKQGRKSEFVAPPSSTSFHNVVAAQAQTEASKAASPSVPAPPPPLPLKNKDPAPPPPPGESKPPAPAPSSESTTEKPKTGPGGAPRGNFKPQPQILDDDDFSVAPSLSTAMRSVCGHNFDDVYMRGKKLGYGAFANVFLAVHKPTGEEYAIKQVDRSKMMWGQRDALKDEIDNMKLVRAGPNIVQLYEVFEEKVYSFLVTELMTGGELFDRIIEKKTFTEEEARSCCQCVLSALEFMHKQRVAHRDLKPENLLLASRESLLPVKLADFGFAKAVAKKNGCRTLCGTPGYLAPEILERWPAYDVKCDIWSVGVILFLLLGGYLPFDADDEQLVFDRTRNGQYDFRPKFWRHISNGAKDLVSQCLTINPNKRASATSALQHGWMSVGASELATHQVDVGKLKDMVQARRKMKAAVKTLMAANRFQQLNDDFTVYMEKRRGESIVSHFSYMTSSTRTGHKRYEEDSPSGKPFTNFFLLGEKLGEGENSYIYRATRKQTQQLYAVKHVDLLPLDEESKHTIRDEVKALRLLRGGPHIVRLFDVFQEPENVYFVFETMTGGNLLSRIVEKEVYTEREAQQVCKIAFTAINYCHMKKVAHRDVKPENFLLVEEGDDTSVKLADFAFAKRCVKENSLLTLCGTAQYVAPEILDEHSAGYDQRCDNWSLGVFAFVLLGGYPPFEGVTGDLANEIKNADYKFHDEYWKDVSASAKEMIRSLLVVNPKKRATASDALACEWMASEEEQLVLRDLSTVQSQINDKVEPKNKVKMAVQTIIARNKFMSIAGMKKDLLISSRHSIDQSILEEDESFDHHYTWGEQIGIGTFSAVHEVTSKESGTLFAAKKITRKDLHPSDAVALHDEISALRKVAGCEQVVKLHDVYDEPDHTVLVLEIMGGGDLIDRIIEKRHYTEYDAKEVSRKLIMGVAHCHKFKIANRNLKPESLLLKAGSDIDVKISDFGYAKTVAFPNSLRTQCGTEGYVAPEILEHRPAYGIECDMWSLGVVIYIVLGGYRPFRGEGEEVMKQIRYGEYKFHKRYWSHVSKEAKSLIQQLLTVDPQQRIKAEEALKSEWVTAEESALDTIELSSNMKELKNLRSAKSKLRSAVKMVVATQKLQSLSGFRSHQDF
mmetsp:Transcript_44514/g.107258  ORF Transcript_44514/g.107258 Transcript_44514/m.107258 type:complete len:1230 (-) Transcript_44514:3643-7332(-)